MTPKTNGKHRGLSQSDYARHRASLGLRGATRQSVSEAVKSGRISVDAHGKIPDAELADVEWNENTDPRRIRAEELGDVPSLAESRAKEAELRARLLQIQVDKETGALLPKVDVEARVFALARATRDHLLRLPDRIAAELAGLDDLQEIQRRLTEAVNEALAELQNLRLGGNPINEKPTNAATPPGPPRRP
jgi:hypothetical protein